MDLIDEEQKIGIQVTSSMDTEKIRHTLEKVSTLDIPFQRVIVLFISSRSVTRTMKVHAGTMELWNIPDVYRDAIALDTDRLREIIDLMDKELGSIRGMLKEQPHLGLPIGSHLQSSDFVGREAELAEISSRFAAGDKLVVLTGLGGMGKTELAAHYAREHSGMVHFVRFDTSFTRTLANMAQAIRPGLSEDALREDESARSRRVLAMLKESHSGDLLVIDNADGNTGNLADLQKDPGYAALVGLPLKLLITTRSYVPRAIQVEPMFEDNLKKIFRNHGATLTDGEMTNLVRAVNGHTMTIDLIARTLTAREWRQVRAEQILTALREHTLPSQKYQKITTDYGQSPDQAQIYTHLSVVFDVSEVPGDGQQVLRCATLLPEDGMDAESFGTALEEAQQNALDDLLERGWLEINGGLLTIHPVIRMVCREELKPGDDCIAFLIAQMADVFANAVEFAGDAEAKAVWLNFSGRLWVDLLEFRRAVSLYEQYLPDLELQLPDHPAHAIAYNNVGITYGNLGDHSRALEYQQKALAIRESVLPKNHPNLAQSYDNVGTAYGALGNHSRALEYQRKALVIKESVLPKNHPDLATAYNNAGSTYSCLGDHQKALEYLLKALAIKEAELPKSHPDLATSYRNIAGTYYELGQLPEAAQYMRWAADIISRSSLPEDHSGRVNITQWAVQFEREAEMQRAMMEQMKQWGMNSFRLPGK